MKLKSVVTAMVALGLVASTSAVMAATTSTTSTDSANQSTAISDSQVTAMQAVINRNQDNVVADPASLLTDWFKYVTVSGEFKTDFIYSEGKVGNTSTKPSTQLSLSTAELYVDAEASDWAQTHVAIDYGNDWTASNSNRLSLFFSEAYATLSNFAKLPVWFRAGKMYLNFGTTGGQPEIPARLSALLATANDITAEAGYIGPMGLSGDVYAFNGYNEATQTSNSRINGWGADLGFNKSNYIISYGLNLGYINNMYNVMDIAFANGTLPNTAYNTKKVPGVSAQVTANSGPFGLEADYVKSLNSFNPLALATVNGAGAKPSAYDVDATYDSAIGSHKTTTALSYGQSENASGVTSGSTDVLGGFLMPARRYAVGYNFWISKNARTKLSYFYDQLYKTTAGSGHDNSIVARLDVMF